MIGLIRSRTRAGSRAAHTWRRWPARSPPSSCTSSTNEASSPSRCRERRSQRTVTHACSPVFHAGAPRSPQFLSHPKVSSTTKRLRNSSEWTLPPSTATRHKCTSWPYSVQLRTSWIRVPIYTSTAYYTAQSAVQVHFLFVFITVLLKIIPVVTQCGLQIF